MRFFESGKFQPQGTESEVAFSNVYRWITATDRIRLLHERHGRDQPVWLFDLVPDSASHALTAAHPHICGSDHYTARLELNEEGFDLLWTIQGPRKDEFLHYSYR